MKVSNYAFVLTTVGQTANKQRPGNDEAQTFVNFDFIPLGAIARVWSGWN